MLRRRDNKLNKMDKSNSDVLRKQLTNWEEAVTDAIIWELVFLGRTVAISELEFNPFMEEISICIDGIYLNGDQEPVLFTSFADTDSKSLSQCMSDSDIDSRGLLGLLEGLRGIQK